MKQYFSLLPAILIFYGLLSVSSFCHATNRYVSLSGANIAPFTSWATAANTIQAAVDVCGQDDVVWVTNGIYAVGGATTPGASLYCRMVVIGRITVRSVNGPESVIVLGQGPVSVGAVRCAYLNKNARLFGLTLSNGHTRVTGDVIHDRSGGAVLIDDNGSVNNCIVSCNVADDYGGGVVCNNGGSVVDTVFTHNTSSNNGGALYIDQEGWVSDCTFAANRAVNDGGAIMSAGGGVLSSCQFFDNRASNYGGGIYGNVIDEINNCLFTRNTSRFGGGIAINQYGVCRNTTICGNYATQSGGGISLRGTGISNFNCIVYYNYSTGSGTNYVVQLGQPFFGYSCTFPAPNGVANITSQPYVQDRDALDYHLRAGSPCIGTGNNLYSPGDTDLDGHQRILGSPQLIDMGCYEFIPLDTATVSDHYVSHNGANLWPYTSWATAAHAIQDAIEAAVAGDSVLVADGTYDTVYRGAMGMKNRVMISKPITVFSPGSAIISGSPDLATGSLGSNAVRCAYITNNASLVGFTLQNGHTRAEGDTFFARGGGGAFIHQNCFISNCVVSGNAAHNAGGVIAFGSLVTHTTIQNNKSIEAAGGLLLFLGGHARYCTISENSSEIGGGAAIVYFPTAASLCSDQLNDFNGISLLEYSTISNNDAYVIGAGVFCGGNSELHNCIIIDNNAIEKGGGIYFDAGGKARNSLITGNAAINGGGVYYSSAGSLVNCTVAKNTAVHGGGGLYCDNGGVSINTIIYDNTRILSGTSNYYNIGRSGLYEYCCTVPALTDSWNGVGNIWKDPLFEDKDHYDFRLLEGSFCIDAGSNMAWMISADDLDGNPRINDGIVDMGCYEFIPEPVCLVVILLPLFILQHRRKWL